MEMLEIDASHAGGQLLRTALSLSLCTQTPFRMRGIRAGREKPGLMRQHLTAVEAACAISSATVDGASAGAQEIRFRPGPVHGGDYRFAIGTAGSTTLVLQTLLPALWHTHAAASLCLEGGTHNPLAPPVDFLREAFLPLLARMQAHATITLDRYGFAPAGGGQLSAVVPAAGAWLPLHLLERGALLRTRARALISGIAAGIAERELKVAARHFGLEADQLEHVGVRPANGPGNAFMLVFEFEHVTEVFTGFGTRNVTAERVAQRTCREAQHYLAADVAVGAYLADQLLLPLALAGGGEFSTLEPSAHTRSNAALIETFLPVKIDFRHEHRERWIVSVR